MTLQDFLTQHRRVAIALSGGVDSALLLAAARACGCDVHAYCAESAFQPAHERAAAMRLAEELDVPLTCVPVDILAAPHVAENGAERCYYCKRALFAALHAAAAADGYALLLDGTNATDDAGDRPGLRALEELGVRSPLRLCGLGKAEIRRRAKDAGLFLWDKPAYACLATRIPTGTALCAADLDRVARAEDALFRLGFCDFRVRLWGDTARLQLPAAQMAALLAQRDAVMAALAPLFTGVVLDLTARAEME